MFIKVDSSESNVLGVKLEAEKSSKRTTGNLIETLTRSPPGTNINWSSWFDDQVAVSRISSVYRKPRHVIRYLWAFLLVRVGNKGDDKVSLERDGVCLPIRWKEGRIASERKRGESKEVGNVPCRRASAILYANREEWSETPVRSKRT